MKLYDNSINLKCFNELPYLVCEAHTDGKIYYVNDFFCKYFKISKTDALKTNGFEFIAMLNSVDYPVVRKKYESLDYKNPTVKIIFKSNYTGKTFWLMSFVEAIIDENNEKQAYHIAAFDITESKILESTLKKIQLKNKTLFEDSMDAVFITDKSGKILNVNKAGTVLFGKPGPELIGRMIQSFYGNEEDRLFFNRVIREKGRIKEFEIVLKSADNKTKIGLVSAVAIKNKNMEIIEVNETIKDISLRVKNEQLIWKNNLELLELNEQIRAAQTKMVSQEKMASIGQLAAGVAHEINNPLGFVKSNMISLKRYVNALSDYSALYKKILDEKNIHDAGIDEFNKNINMEFVFEDLPDLLEETENGIERIINIVKSLKSFSRIDAEQNWSDFDINSAIKDTLVVTRNEYKYIADIITEYGELPSVECIGTEINQVILNMIINSCQAIKSQNRKEKGKIIIRTYMDGAWVVIEIEDDGPGVPKEIANRIYEPFYTTKKIGEGTGLGLSISYDIIVHKHKGKIDLKSKNGAKFIIKLPIHNPAGKTNGAT